MIYKGENMNNDTNFNQEMEDSFKFICTQEVFHQLQSGKLDIQDAFDYVCKGIIPQAWLEVES